MDLPIIPDISSSSDNEFLKLLNKSGHRWVILTNELGEPLVAVDSDGFLRDAFFEPETFDPYKHCHRPTIITDESTMLNDAIIKMKMSESTDKTFDGAIERDVLLVWGESKRIITGADIFGLLLKGMQPQELKIT